MLDDATFNETGGGGGGLVFVTRLTSGRPLTSTSSDTKECGSFLMCALHDSQAPWQRFDFSHVKCEE